MLRVKTSLSKAPRSPKPAIPRLNRSSKSNPRFDLQVKPALPALSNPSPIAGVVGKTSPRADGEKLATFVIKYTVNRDTSRKAEIKKSEPLKKAMSKDVSALFTRKCQACCAFPDFSRPAADEDLKATKLDLLNELYFGLQNPVIAKMLNGDALGALFKMISCNLLRKFPNVQLQIQPEFVIDNEYAHVDVVYKILNFLLQFRTIPKQVITGYMSQVFILAVFMNVCAYDAREQKSVVDIMLLVIDNFPFVIQPLFRKISKFCMTLESDFRFGHALPSVIDVMAALFSEVLKGMKNVEKFFMEVVLPLHKVDNYDVLQRSLTQIVLLILKKNGQLLRTWALFMASHWAVRSHVKCAAMFDEVSQVTEIYAAKIDDEAGTKLALKISEFFADPSGDVSQQALFVMNSDAMADILRRCSTKVVRQLYRRALKVNLTHWLPDTRHFALDLMTGLGTIDPSLKKLVMVSEEEYDIAEEKRKNETWKLIIGKMPEENVPVVQTKIRAERSLSLSKFTLGGKV